MNSDISPEEKLLRLIRGQKKYKASGLAQAASANKVRGRFNIKFNLPGFKRFLWGMLLVSFVYLLTCILWPWVFKHEKLDVSNIKQETMLGREQEAPEIKQYEFYQESIIGRKIFSPLGPQPSEGQKTDLGVSFTERIKSLTLLGIVLGDSPQAIIEDKKTQQTYFLEKGKSLESIRVEEIGDGKVTLEFQGQSFDLFL